MWLGVCISGSPVSRRKLTEPAQLPPTETGLSASSAQSGLSTNLTVRRRTNSTSTRLPPERSELSANSAVRRGTEALRTAWEIRRAVFPGIPSPIRHSWSFWLVVGQGARYTNTPRRGNPSYRALQVFRTIRANSDSHQHSANESTFHGGQIMHHVETRVLCVGNAFAVSLHAARTVHVPSTQGVHCENCATNNASPSPRRVRGTRQQ